MKTESTDISKFTVIDPSNSENQLDVIRQFAIDMVNVTDKDKLYWHVAREVVSKLGFVDCVIYEIDDYNKCLVQCAAYGNKNPTADEIDNLLTIPIGKGVTGSVAKSGQPLVIADASRDKRYIHDIEDNLSEICVPINYDNRVRGVIDCEDPQINHFTADHLKALTTIAAMLSSKLLQIDINFYLHHSNQALIEEYHKSHNAEQALKEHQNTLENRVEKRTQELQQSLLELKQETKQKLKAEESLRQNQAMLFQSAKMASIGTLAAGVAHEINNPIAYIKSNLQMLGEYLQDMNTLLQLQSEVIQATDKNSQERVLLINNIETFKQSIGFDDLQDELDDLLNVAIEGTSRVTKIVSELKDFSHEDTGEMEKHDINELVNKAMAIAMNEMKYKAEITKDFQRLPKIYCRSGKLIQVFLNILVNAAQAIDKHGEIFVSTCANDSFVEVIFTDTGVGIEKEVVDKIFDPFFTTKDVGIGTGLGLHISHNIIENHAGSLKVKSVPGKGTSMKVRLPIDHRQKLK